MMDMGKVNMTKEMSQAAELVARLERISVDSYWAHRAGGLRVALLRQMDRLHAIQGESSELEVERLDSLLEQGYHILESAAREIWTKTY